MLALVGKGKRTSETEVGKCKKTSEREEEGGFRFKGLEFRV
jgi:hypothetical protein